MELIERARCHAELTEWLRRAGKGTGSIALIGRYHGLAVLSKIRAE